MGTRSGIFFASENRAAAGTGTGEWDFGLGLRMQQQQQQQQHKDSSSSSYPRKKMMMVMPPPPHHHQTGGAAGFCGDGSGGCGGVGPLFCNSSNQVTCLSDIYDVVGGAAQLVSRTQQYPSQLQDALPFNFSGGMATTAAASSVRVHFTAAQWQELQRQTMIYKYMMASIPVPPELLIPITTKTPISSNAAIPSPRSSNMGRGSLELGFSSNSDPEPWRCRRTDGKKWRCSRDVAPDQKYCERHTHKGRPRSRKPVELHNNSDFNKINSNKSSMSNKSATNVVNVNVNNQSQREREEDQLCSFPSAMMVSASSATSYDQPRCLDWFIKGETIPIANVNANASPNQEWHHSNSRSVALKRDHEKLYEDPLMSLRSYTDFSNCNGNGQNDHCSLLLGSMGGGRGSGGGGLISNQTQETRLFIDAWSAAERDEIGNHKCSVSSNGKLPFSSLTLSMSGGDDTNKENGIALMGLGTMCGAERESIGDLKPNWTSPVSWMSSPPGGPLAEALCLGIASSAKLAQNAAASSSPSPHGCSSSTTTSTSKSSGGDGGQGLNFID